MAAGSIDAFDTWEPHVANARKALGENATQLDTRGIYSETFNIVVTQPFLAAQSSRGRQVSGGSDRGRKVAEGPSGGCDHDHRNRVGMNRDELASIWSDYVYKVRIDDQLLDTLKTHAAWRLSSGNHPPNAIMPDFATVLALDPLKSLDPKRVTVREINYGQRQRLRH